MDTIEYTVPDPVVLTDQEAQLVVKVVGTVTLPELDELLKQKDAEIETFKQAHATALKTQLVLHAEIDRLKAMVDRRDAEYDRLCTRYETLEEKQVQTLELVGELAAAINKAWNGSLNAREVDDLIKRAVEISGENTLDP